MSILNTLRAYAAEPFGSAYTVSDEAYRAALQDPNVDLDIDKLREWRMPEERIAALIHLDNRAPLPGCTDKEAFNFNPDATVDDGSCEYMGCTDPKATNYNPKATIDDGSCLFEDTPPQPPPPPPPPKETLPGVSLQQLEREVEEGRIRKSAVLRDLELSEEDWDNISRHYNQNPIPDWEGIPVLPAKKTDLWVLGIPGSGKSAMLSTILGRMAERGSLMGPNFSVHLEGFKYRTYLETAYRLKMFPEATQTKGFNFVPMDMVVDLRKRKYQPANLIEMAGGKIQGLLENRDSNDQESLVALDWLESNNTKVVTIVLDMNSRDLHQNAELNMAFQLLSKRGVLKKTSKIILLCTKADLLASFSPEGSDELNAEVKKLVHQNFGSLVMSIKALQAQKSNKKMTVTICPFTVGSDIVKEKYLRGERHNAFIDNYILELRNAVEARKMH